MRTVSILAVVLIHSTTKTLELTHYDLNNTLFTLFLNQMARFAVPLFFLISGFVLELSAGKDFNYWSYTKKRFSKIVIPYIFWSLIYYFLVYNQNHDNLIRVLLTGNASYQLYFIPALCIFYLLFPLLHKIYKFIANVPVLAVLGIVQIGLMCQDYFVKQFIFPDPLRISILAYFFFIIGMVAARNKDRILETVGRIKYTLIIAVPALAYFVFEEGRMWYFKTYNIEAFYSQWRISVLIYTLVLGAVLFYIFNKPRFQFKIVGKLSKLSYMVFFIHVMILEEIWKYLGYKLFDLMGGNAFGKIAFDPLLFTSVAAVSFGIAFIIHKIPYLSKITG
jgi:surface polysaccharide O-acyltransferase-like enzyme